MRLTLEEAIKYNEELQQGIDVQEMPKHYAAVQLGIEALKEIEDCRVDGGLFGVPLLPDETEK